MKTVTLPTYYYQQFDANYSLEVPGEGYGGWKKADLELNLDKTALVVMHAWKTGDISEHPGSYRKCEYLPRARQICEDIFPALLQTARRSGLRIYHVVTDEGYNETYYKDYPGYRDNLGLEGYQVQKRDTVANDPVMDRLRRFKTEHVFPGLHNIGAPGSGEDRIDFAREAVPLGNEGIAENTEQLFSLCGKDGVNHLIYTGFALEMCLLVSPGGMCDMNRRNIMCSTIRQAVTAVENRETARNQLIKEIGLWRVALSFGFVYDLKDFIDMLNENTP